MTQLLDQGRSAHVDVRDASGQLLQRDNVVYAQFSANWTLQYTPDQFEVDLSERTVRRKPSGIVFSFYEYTSEADWQRSDSVTMRDVPTWAGDRTRLAAFAKQAAIDSGMKAGRMRGLREKLEHAPQTAQQFDRERALKQWRESVDHLFPGRGMPELRQGGESGWNHPSSSERETPGASRSLYDRCARR